jgi:Peptidase_C39 like family
MKIHYTVPFYPNTPDNIHCLQSSMKMVHEYFCPNDSMTFDQWDVITAHVPGLWTWSIAGTMWFLDHGFAVVSIEAFDYGRFVTEGEKYLLDFAGEEVGRSQIEHSDIEQEMRISKEFVKKIKSEIRAPTVVDIRTHLSQEYLVICNVNAEALYGYKGYSGHAIVVVGYTDSGLIIHDPGLPPNKDFEVADDVFYKSWAYPDDKATNLTAIRLKNK